MLHPVMREKIVDIILLQNIIVQKLVYLANNITIAVQMITGQTTTVITFSKRLVLLALIIITGVLL